MNFRTVLALLAGLSAAPLAAQETRVGEAGFESPPATIADAEWLVGQWSGEGIGGAEAHESWLSPSGTTMVGTFVQELADGSIMFTEHMYLTEQDGSLVVKLKHFNPDMTAWEEKDGMLTFRLLAAEPCALYFSALTLRCTTAEEGEGGLVVSVRMRSDKPEVQELVFRFTRSGQTNRTVCANAMTTLDMNDCYADVLATSDERRARYLAAAIALAEANAEEMTQGADDMPPDTAVIAQMRVSETAFEAYREAECGAVWEEWKGGTIRTLMALVCRIELTDRRTFTLWQNWLAQMGTTSSILPEPKPTL